MKYKNAIVLTGGIGTGKSTVGSFLKMFGYKIIDADKLSREVFEEKKEEIKKIFGTTDRKELRKIVFNDKKKLNELENIILPEVKQKVFEMAEKYEKDNVPYFVDLPLYYEKQNYKEFEKVLLVYAPKEIQLQRVTKRDNATEEEVISILNNQLDIEDKKKMAHFVIDNSKDLKHLQKEIENFLKMI